MELSNEEKVLLEKLVNNASKSKDHFAQCYSTGLSGKIRKEMCEKLENEGYIKVELYSGKDQVSCFVTTKAFEYFGNN